ncbi:MAG TPA: SpoIID/LytB domain-containing protein, partial [Acetivibrio sp.]|nr:SpoIID/LytB domain-containing protein [Acetivibrio sp.]
TYNGKPASVFYFSSSGGRTEDVKNVWGSDGYPYLISVEDKYESGDSWHYNWEVSFTAQKIKQIMIDRGFNLGDILGIFITKRSEAGRATEVVVKGSKDERIYTNGSTRSFLSLDSQWYEITTDADTLVMGVEGEPVKTQLGGKKVMTASGLKTISASGNSVSVVSSGSIKKIPIIPTIYTIIGKGWGHSVGMSQEGAKGMAKAGFTYKEILAHYFAGTKVE